MVFRSYLPGLTRILKLRGKSLALSQESPYTKEGEELGHSFDGLLKAYASQSQKELASHQENLLQSLEKNFHQSEAQKGNLHQEYFQIRGKVRGQKLFLGA